FAFHFGNLHGLRMIYQRLSNVLDQILHLPPPTARAKTNRKMAFLYQKEITTFLGCRLLEINSRD
ncbi:MAG: hypothetical protein JSV60_11920, partial [Desulfobacterales bacterium]